MRVPGPERAKTFLNRDEYTGQAEQWNRIEQAVFSPHTTGDHFETRVADYIPVELPRAPEEYVTTINNIHQQNFIEQVIPEVVDRLKSLHRKPRILDSGTGLGIFPDQLRDVFGEQIVVYGTSVANASQVGRTRAIRRKQTLLKQIHSRQEKVEDKPLTPHEQALALVLHQIHPTIHPNDAKWASILQLRDFPEFDIIIDTYGELYYSSSEGIKEFDRKLVAALHKLQVGGAVYIGQLDSAAKQHLWENAAQLAQNLKVQILWGGLSQEQILSEVNGANLDMNKTVFAAIIKNTPQFKRVAQDLSFGRVVIKKLA